MKKFIRYRFLIFVIIILLFGICLTPLSITKTIGKNYKIYSNMIDGQILFAPIYSTSTFLIDKDGNEKNSWTSNTNPGQAVYMADNGAILRTTRLTLLAPGGAGGGIQKITKEGTIIWEFTYYTNEHLSHHDIEPLSNGNILMIAWEYKTREEAISAGRDPNTIIGNKLMPDHIIEVKPTGPTTGEIVWEWHAWDHLIQDYDPLKNNYGVVEDHPELIDINFGASVSSTNADWLHTNSIDYNEEFDQILLSIHNFHEIWIIDHSTTTEEATGHSGGNSGKGGDLLYRWGNPRSYGEGNTSDQKFFGQHDATWIEEDCPGEGNILVFNNGISRTQGKYSSVDEIVPPVNENGDYYLEPGSSYGPDKQIWIYTADNPTDFFSHYVSGAERLPNGNTLICDGPAGRFFEVTPQKETVWQYINTDPGPLINDVFKVDYISFNETQPVKPDLDSIGNLHWPDVKRGTTLEGNFFVKNIGCTGSHLDWKIESCPDWGIWEFNPNSGVNLTTMDGKSKVKVSVVVPDKENSYYEGFIRIENQNNPNDYDVIPIYLKTPRKRTTYKSFLDFLSNQLNMFPILKLIMQKLEL